MELPAELQEGFRNELYQYEEERRMPYLSSIERLAIQKGRQEGAREELLLTIQTLLKEKFGSVGSRTMAKVKLIDELPRLRSLSNALRKIDSLQEFRALLE
jgi:hypothetical protein